MCAVVSGQSKFWKFEDQSVFSFLHPILFSQLNHIHAFPRAQSILKPQHWRQAVSAQLLG